ncbi:MAG: 50S ribosomal protein L22 [Actinobacteria bacterium]|nr:50S ribosomal protein L22 [Actinomycetota bacterium]
MATAAPETKTNERPGVRAQVRYVRCSAYKAREVLDLIRGKHVSQALELLEFSERSIADIILKCLESAIANASHNNDIPDDELYVSACYADEGPTLKRWRPRARGRATRIRKRTCHITVIVSRLEPEALQKLRERETAAGRGNVAAAEARRRRVLRSRSEKAERKAAERAAHDHDHEDGEHEHADHDDEITDEVGAEEVETDAVETDAVEDAEVDDSGADVIEDAPVADTDPETGDDDGDGEQMTEERGES